MRRGVTMLAAISVAATATLSGTNEQVGPFVSTVRHATLEVIDDGQHDRIMVPVDFVKGVDPRALAVNLMEVLYGDRPDAQLLQAFRPSLSVDGIDITIDYKLMKRAGTYHLVLDLIDTRPKAGKTAGRQRVEVALIHPPAKLRVPASLLIVRTEGIVTQTTAPPSFKVFEESRRSRATLQFESISASHEGLPVAATIGFKDAELPLGKSVDVIPYLSDTFPIGSTKAMVAARADQIEEPVTFEVEIRARRPGWWVFPIILSSALLGWVLRVYLKHTEEFYALAAQGDELVAALERERQATLPDQKALLVAAIAEVTEASLGGDEKGLTEAIRNGNAALSDSQGQRKQWRTDTLDSLGKIRATLNAPWRLPVPADLDEMRRRLAEALGRALDGDIAGTTERQSELNQLLSALIDPGRTWAQRAARALTDAENEVQAPIAARPIAKTAADALAAAAALDVATPPSVDMLLKTLHVAQIDLIDYARDVVWQVARLGDNIAAALEDPDQSAKLQGAAKIVGDPEATPIEVVDAVAPAISKIRETLRAAINEIVAEPHDETVQQIRDLVDAGKFLEAARRIATSVNDDDTRMRIASGARRGANATGTEPPSPHGSPGLTVGSPTQIYVVDDGQRPDDPLPINSLRRLFITRAVRGIAAALIMAGAATLLYYDTFVGTATEILGLAAVGFMSDFTFESALDVVLKRRS